MAETPLGSSVCVYSHRHAHLLTVNSPGDSPTVYSHTGSLWHHPGDLSWGSGKKSARECPAQHLCTFAFSHTSPLRGSSGQFHHFILKSSLVVCMFMTVVLLKDELLSDQFWNIWLIHNALVHVYIYPVTSSMRKKKITHSCHNRASTQRSRTQHFHRAHIPRGITALERSSSVCQNWATISQSNAACQQERSRETKTGWEQCILAKKKTHIGSQLPSWMGATSDSLPFFSGARIRPAVRHRCLNWPTSVFYLGPHLTDDWRVYQGLAACGESSAVIIMNNSLDRRGERPYFTLHSSNVRCLLQLQCLLTLRNSIAHQWVVRLWKRRLKALNHCIRCQKNQCQKPC